MTVASVPGQGLVFTVPLPGGAPSGPSYVVTAEFTDVLDLVPRSAVKVNDVTVGSVEKIWLNGWTARVRMRVSTSVRLPDNATAAVQQSSLLGEKFVALAAPVGEAGQGEFAVEGRQARPHRPPRGESDDQHEQQQQRDAAPEPLHHPAIPRGRVAAHRVQGVRSSRQAQVCRSPLPST